MEFAPFYFSCCFGLPNYCFAWCISFAIGASISLNNQWIDIIYCWNNECCVEADSSASIRRHGFVAEWRWLPLVDLTPSIWPSVRNATNTPILHWQWKCKSGLPAQFNCVTSSLSTLELNIVSADASHPGYLGRRSWASLICLFSYIQALPLSPFW